MNLPRDYLSDIYRGVTAQEHFKDPIHHPNMKDSSPPQPERETKRKTTRGRSDDTVSTFLNAFQPFIKLIKRKEKVGELLRGLHLIFQVSPP